MAANAAASDEADLSAFKEHDLHVVPSNATLTFEHTYTWWGNKRKLRVLAQPNVTLGWGHVPPHCRRARTVLLGPLMPEDIDCKSFVHKSRGRPLAPLSSQSFRNKTVLLMWCAKIRWRILV